MSEDNAYDPTPGWKALVDRVVAAGYTCQSVLVRLDARLARTPLGVGRDNLLAFRQQLVEEINSARRLR